MQPNRVFGVIPRFDATITEEPSAVERIAISCDRERLVCVAHENAVQICDLGFLRDQEGQHSDDAAQQVS